VSRQFENLGSIDGCTTLDWNPNTAAVLVAFKDLGVMSLAKLLGSELAKGKPTEPIDYLLPAPSSPAATRRRGYVPAHELARVLSRAWAIPVLKADLARPTSDQAKLDAAARRQNLAGAIKLPPVAAGKRLWLVDDIVTTGATLGELTRAASRVGASVAGFSTLAESSLKRATQI
jgi:predicted amidophosphoribosyltransferase